MDHGEVGKSEALNISEDVESRSAVNSLILDYYKKFGRKRDLEQYFSLSTAQSDIQDPTSTFWRRMKTQTESSDSGEGKSESSQELCRISIKCSVPQPSGSQVTTTNNLAGLHPYLAKRLYKDDEPKSKTESESPPIINEDHSLEQSRHSDDDSVKSDDNHSQKSFDVLLDLSTNKPHSPSSSITSQRKLEWDSLADVGYGNESDRKNSASSLSTLERLALKQQYSNNDTKQDNEIGPPTAHSTPLEDNDNKSKGKKGVKKSTKFFKKDVDVLEVNVPHTSNTSPSQAINVNLTKHISFSVDKSGGVTFENVKKDIFMSPEKDPVGREIAQLNTVEKEMQTSLTNTKNKSDSSYKKPEPARLHIQRVPILISVNTLRKRNKRRKLRVLRRKLNSKKKIDVDKVKEPQAKSLEQLSEAESFEYMPGHIYNQNQLKANQSSNTAGNKSSLESSGILTTDSSKDSKHSLTNDLEKGIELLKGALQQRYDDSHLRKKLVQELVQRLLKSKYRDDETTTEFLSGLSFGSKKLGLSEGNHTTTSTSDANNTGEKPKMTRPKKSILRVDKFNANAIASTSQSAPNLPSATNSDKPVSSNLIRTMTSSNTESDISSKEKTSSDNAFAKTSSEELYKKYIEAFRREESYKKHLRDKEMFLKQKLVSSDSVYKPTARQNLKTNNKLKDLIQDLTRNNYDDGSGDASKLECGSNSNINVENAIRTQRSHSVFTFSSGQSDCQNKKPNMKKRLQNDIKDLARAGTSKDGAHLHCCCPHHSPKVGVNDSSVQVNIKYDGSSIECHRRHAELIKSSDGTISNRGSPRNLAHVVSDNVTGDIKYVCLCINKAALNQENNDYLVYKCSRLTDRGIQLQETASNLSTTVGVQCECTSHKNNQAKNLKIKDYDKLRRESSYSATKDEFRMNSKSSQTNLALKIICQKSSDKSISTSSSSSDFNRNNNIKKRDLSITNIDKKKHTSEATRCIQTEISINPKISDPSLTDINIINDSDCVNLIREQNKIKYNSNDMEVSSIGSEGGNKKRVLCNDERPDVECGDSDNLSRNKNVASKQIQSNVGQTFSTIETQIRKMQHVENIADNFAIPIQGTNMTVMVRIGANDPKPASEAKNNEVITQNIGTDLPTCADQATSLLEECSKGVQSQNTDTYSTVNKTPNTENGIEQSSSVEVVPPIEFSHVVKPCLTNEPKYKHNTFPKNEHLIERKPLFRSNTDTGNLGNCCVVQTNDINKQDGDNKTDSGISRTQKNSQSTKGTVTDELSKMSFCGCGSINCNCGEHKCHSEPLAHTDTGHLENCGSQTDKMNKKDTETQINLAITQPQTTEISIPTDEQSIISICDCGSKSCSCGKQKCYLKKKEKTCMDTKPVSLSDDKEKRDMGTQKKLTDDSLNKELIPTDKSKLPECGCPQPSKCKGLCGKQCNNSDHSAVDAQNFSKIKQKSSQEKELSDNKVINNLKLSRDSGTDNEHPSLKDPILDMIKDITQKYSKKDIEKNKKRKCFKEIITVLNYLLDTEDSTDNDDHVKSSSSATTNPCCKKTPEKRVVQCDSPQKKKFVNKGIQMSFNKCMSNAKTESSDIPISTEIPSTSSDSATCRVLNRIRKECERFHQKRCKSFHSGGKKCDASSSTSVNCEKCMRIHHCPCRGHKCKGYKSKSAEKVQKTSVAYNLIIQTSDSVVGEETTMSKDNNLRPLKNIIVKVPSKRQVVNVPFKEMSAKIEKGFRCCSAQHAPRSNRSRSLPNENEILGTNVFTKNDQCYTVRDYLERNRPDFVEKSSNRQECLKFISQTRVDTIKQVTQFLRANERDAQRNVLSLHVDRRPELTPTSDELRHLAQEIGVKLRRRKEAPKFISEREMKKHSENIYKSLPEVVQKKEDIKKENIKKTNLLMASIFRKYLQKKTLRGAVNLSNYSTIIKI